MAIRTINILSLCSGIGGLDLGVSRALKRLGFNPRVICYVEGEAFSAACLVKKMETGEMDDAPVWSDVKTFDCKPWRGKVDCVIGGFPCQPFSVAGKSSSINHEKHLWPDVFRVLEESKARLAFFENVPGLVRSGLLDVIKDLSGVGFNAEWDLFSASEEGANHIRKRLFIFANSNGGTLRDKPERMSGGWSNSIQRAGDDVPLFFGRKNGRGVKPSLCRMDDGVPSRVDGLRALGNAVVPQCAERAFLELWDRSILNQ